MAVETENLSREEWLDYLRQGIGGSDVAGIMGISPFFYKIEAIRVARLPAAIKGTNGMESALSLHWQPIISAAAAASRAAGIRVFSIR